jgi:NAD(P)-dependent dehydrogenase (short-subunit alcohol dehydrogenase family)
MENNMIEDTQLQDRVALITGASSGIGRATACLFASRGAHVAALARTEDETRRAADEIRRSTGSEALPIVADISQPNQMEHAVQQIVDRWGRLDIVFANAGINGVWAPIEELTPEEWNETLQVNLSGTFLTIKYSVPYLKREGGAIIITSSINGTRVFSNSGATAYSCSKAGQVALAKMLALELADDGVRVNVICPGWIDTEIAENTELRDLEHVPDLADYPEGKVPLTGGRPGQPEQVARLALFLASGASSLVTGTEVWIDGAESLLLG